MLTGRSKDTNILVEFARLDLLCACAVLRFRMHNATLFLTLQNPWTAAENFRPYADFRRRRRQKGPVDLPPVPQGIMINGCVSLLTFKSDGIVNA